MKPAARSTPTAGQPVVAIDARPGTTFVVVLSTSTPPRVLETLELAPGDSAAVAAVASRHHTSRIVAVANVGESIARVIAAPEVSAVATMADRASSHSLAAEASLPDGVPSWRVACGPWPGGNGMFVIAAGLLSEPGIKLPNFDLTFAAAPACLAALCGTSGAAKIADPAHGGACELDLSQSTPLMRCFVADSEGTDQAPTIRLPASLSREIASRVVVPTVDLAWLERYGLAIGAAMLANAPDSLTASLASLRWKALVAAESFPVRLVRWIAEPARAAVVLVGVLLLLVLGRWGAAYVRHAVLDSKVASMDGSRSTREELQKRAALYNQLANERTGRLPFTKLLHDVSRVAPVGVSIPSLRISPEQGIVLQGISDKAELITTFEQNLNASKLFRNLKRTRIENTDEGVEFELTAEVAQPHTPVAAKEDFATTPLAVRLHGPGATNTTVRKVDSETPRADRSSRSSSSTSGESSPSASRRPSNDAATPPAPIADADIAKLARGKATVEWALRRGFLQKNEKSLDGPTKERLAAEVDKLKARMEAAAKEGA